MNPSPSPVHVVNGRAFVPPGEENSATGGKVRRTTGEAFMAHVGYNRVTPAELQEGEGIAIILLLVFSGMR